jgi:dual specificity MAP kinase phosphatase
VVFSIEPQAVAEAIEHQATQPLPDPKLVFPWLHGLHSENSIQLAFFIARRKALRKVPQCLRGITIVKAGGDLSRAKLRGAIAPEELLGPECRRRSMMDGKFLEIDPRDGFSVRNFQIQTCKMATVSDIIVYGDDKTSAEEVLLLSRRIASAQKAWREKLLALGWESGQFNTFAVLGISMAFNVHTHAADSS